MKTGGIEQSAIRHSSESSYLKIPLKPSVVTPNYLKFAISVTYVRPYPDKSHNLHSNGDLNQRQTCSHITD